MKLNDYWELYNTYYQFEDCRFLKSRCRKYVDHKAIFCHILFSYYGYSYRVLANFMHRDRTTILHAIHNTESILSFANDKVFCDKYKETLALFQAKIKFYKTEKLIPPYVYVALQPQSRKQFLLQLQMEHFTP